ncbi:MAG: AAA family ATPase [Desulfovibrionaceae bacterium]|nr:AAA family ATPase [Desulfovibrionaceae bacterium]
MRIRAFHIDAFGVLSQVTVDELPRGMSIFLGNNEAGKSTCLEFFRTVLTGYPPPRTKESRRHWIGSGQKQGGSLHLEIEDGVILRLSRRPGPAGGMPALFDAQGNPVDMAELDRLMGGVTREVYRSIYGFSLSELQSFASLDSEAVRNALYGASFGLGLRSPGAAMARLESSMDELFKPRGKSGAINVVLRRWEEVRNELREAEEDAARYDAVAAEREETHQSLAALRDEKLALEGERRNLERRLGVWKQWEEWRLTRTRLDRLEPVAESFPLDGPARLDRLQDRREEARRRATIAHERMERFNAALADLNPDERLLPLVLDIRALSERKSSCRNALIALPTLRAKLQRAEESLARQLALLGPDWDMERIRRMDRSLFVREELERRAAAIHAADTSLVALSSALERAVRDGEQATHGVELARQALEALPEPVAELDAPAREALREGLLRLEEGERRLPEREKALAASRAEYNRALSYLRLRPDASPAQLQALVAAQEEALSLAEEVRSRAIAAADAAREVKVARKEEEASTDRLKRLLTQEAELSGGDRQALDKRRAALLRLRQSTALLRREEERLDDLGERLAAQEASFPPPRANRPALAAGSVLVAAGAAMLIARLGLGIESVDVPALWAAYLASPVPAWADVAPLPLWAAYLVLCVGVISVAASLPRPGPDRDRNETLLGQLRSRRDASAVRLSELQAEVRSLSEALGVEPDAAMQSEVLDAMDTQLDQEREEFAAGERIQQEKRLLQGELDAKRAQLQARENEHAAAESALQDMQLRWHDYLVRLGVLNVPVPEAAQVFFARVESTRLTRAAAASIEDEIRELRARGPELVAEARRLLPADALPPPPPASSAGALAADELEAVTLVVRRVLESCRQADAQSRERAARAEALRAAEAAAVRASEACAAAESSLRGGRAERAALDTEWREYLNGLGLDLHLSPATTREALDCMERCLSTEAECTRLREETAMQERERDALALPLADLVERAGRTPHLGLDREPDWLATLDIMQRDADNARRMDEERARVLAQSQEQTEELRDAEAAESAAGEAVDELLKLGRADDPESFRRLAAVRDERDALLRRCQDLEDALQLAAGDVPLESFLEEFAALNKDSLDLRSAEVARRLEQLREDEQSRTAALASLDARLADMTASRRLAELRARDASLEENARVLSREWSRLALARELLLDARRHYEKERQPEVVRMASDIFASITDGAWPLVAASLEDSSLRVVPPHGEPLPPDVLSRGAQEQLYLALRLAHIRSHARHATILPVIMDDILVNFDPGRAQRTMRAFADLTAPADGEPGHQILFFTCHPGMAEQLREVVPGSVLFAVDKGRISRVD